MKILVTGSQGYIGSNLALYLADEGHAVRGFDAGFFADCLLPGGTGDGDPPTVRADIRDVTAEHVGNVEAVIHLAALSNDPLGSLNPQLTEEINLGGTRRLLDACKRAGVKRFIFFSTCSVYGASDLNRPLTEEDPASPITPYAVTKLAAEQACREAASPHFSVTVLRLATVYGPSPRQRVDTVLNDLTARALETDRVTLLSDGSAWRPVVFTDDITDLVFALLERPNHGGHVTYNVGDGGNYRVSQLAANVAYVVGGRVEPTPGADADRRSYQVNFSKVNADLKNEWWTLAEGINSLCYCYEGSEVLPTAVGTLLTPRYNRLARLKELIESGKLGEDLRWTNR